MRTAFAADASQRAEARRHYVEGVKHYDLAEYDEALREFKEAYRAAEDPAFLFNMAQCYRKLGNLTEAITFYRSFVRKAPPSANRTEVEKRIADLEREQASRPAPLPPSSAREQRRPVVLDAVASAAAATPAPATMVVRREPSAPAESSPPFYRSGWFWLVAGAVAAGAVATVIVLRPSDEQQSFCPDCATTTGIKQP